MKKTILELMQESQDNINKFTDELTRVRTQIEEMSRSWKIPPENALFKVTDELASVQTRIVDNFKFPSIPISNIPIITPKQDKIELSVTVDKSLEVIVRDEKGKVLFDSNKRASEDVNEN